MLSSEQALFMDQAEHHAELAGHPYPRMAAAEAALESGWGKSGLAQDANNLFGTKQHQHPEYGTLNLPTKEFENGHWETVEAKWVQYPDLTTCFADRLATLTRMAPHNPNYQSALYAKDPYSYVEYVSKSWSTDPQRAEKVKAIYNEATPR